MNNKKNSGPDTLPWGTPQVISSSFESAEPIFTTCRRLVKYEQNKLIKRWSNPISLSLISDSS